MTRLLVIGLDCATPQLVFDAWREELPTLDRLMTEGIHGELTSTIPPITVPAWTSMLSSKDPGQLGFYGFRNRKSHGYEALYFATASHVQTRRVWDYLGEAGLRSIVIGVPQTYPPQPVNGILVSSFLTPDKSAAYTYPPGVKEDLDRIADGDYIIDVRNFRTDDKDWLRDEIYTMTERRFKVVDHYLRNEPWDFFMVVEMGIDRIHHGFWRFHDKDHRLHEPGNRYENVIRDYYRYVDRAIGGLLEGLDPDTAVMVVSDHGAKKMDGAICVNEWLMEKGYLHLKTPVDGPTRVVPDMIDWGKTRVWGEGGYYGRIFLNVRGREPQGVVPEGEYETFRDRVKEELESLGDESGRPIGTRVFKPEAIYRSVSGIPPDLIVYFGDLDWRGAGTVGHGRIHLHENDTGPDDANHAQEGIFILRTQPKRWVEAGLSAGQKVSGLFLYDVAPTMLDLCGCPIPADMIGRSILRPETGRAHPREAEEGRASEGDYTAEEEEMIRKRLEDLGYL
jgi:predicted AlkP superfamily phosphohydrolase/phosphomutase